MCRVIKDFKQEGCFLYSSIGEPIEFADSVSGPKSCTCSEEYACSANEDNEIDFVFGVVKVKILIVIKFKSEYVTFTEGIRLSRFMSTEPGLSSLHMVTEIDIFQTNFLFHFLLGLAQRVLYPSFVFC